MKNSNSKAAALGKLGESIALDFLLKKGYKLLAKNYRFSRAEIDLIFNDETTPVFVEVKTLASKKYGLPEDQVRKAKRRQIAKAAQGWIDQNNYSGEIRFDIVAITLEKGKSAEIYHIPDAFFPGID